jgi:hypothetical protein
MFRLASLILAATTFFAVAARAAAERQRFTMLIEIDGQEVEGMPLAWSSQRAYLLGRDGRLWDFSPGKSSNYRKTSSYFNSFSAAEMRAAMEREFGGRLEVTGTGHYLVAHPRGYGAHWAQRFEDLYRSCVSYFRRRELRVHEPEFPLVAVVWQRREDFAHYAASVGTNVRSDILGFYSPMTNRVLLYDQGGGGNQSVWRQNESTIIHEATHQMAFNIGVHNRFGVTPRWLAEGLGTMFEARGVWDWSNYSDIRDRVNRGRLTQFRQWLKTGRKPGAFVNLVSSDRQFETNPPAAYAESWAWVFFLTEIYPRQFAEYVARTAAHKDFEDYPMARRLSDLTTVFGSDLRLLESHFLSFIEKLD